VCERWLIENDSSISISTFTVNASGDLSILSFAVDAGQLENASEFVVSIEPNPDPDSALSEEKIMGGQFIGSAASLSSENSAAIGIGFSIAAGKYSLATASSSVKDFSGGRRLSGEGLRSRAPRSLEPLSVAKLKVHLLSSLSSSNVLGSWLRKQLSNLDFTNHIYLDMSDLKELNTVIHL